MIDANFQFTGSPEAFGGVSRAYLSCRNQTMTPELSLMQLHFQPGQHRKIIRYNRTPNILPKARPSSPVAPVKPKGPLEPRNVRFNTCTEIPELLVHPVALDHLEYRKALSLREHDILDLFFLGPLEIVFGGKPSISCRLTRYPSVEDFLPLYHGLKHLRIGRISMHDHAVRDNAGISSCKKDLVAKPGIAAALDNDVCVTFKERTDFLGRRNLLTPNDPPFGLIHDTSENRKSPLKLFSQHPGAYPIASDQPCQTSSGQKWHTLHIHVRTETLSRSLYAFSRIFCFLAFSIVTTRFLTTLR